MICDSPETCEIEPEKTEGKVRPHALFQGTEASAQTWRMPGFQALTALFGQSAAAAERFKSNYESGKNWRKGWAMARSTHDIRKGCFRTATAAECALPRVKNASQITARLKNLPDTALADPAGSAQKTSDSFFVIFKRGLVVPPAAAELGTLLRDLIEVILAFLIFCAQGLGGVIKILGHGEPFSLVSRAVRLLFSKTQGLNCLAVSLASTVPEPDPRAEIPVITGASRVHFFSVRTTMDLAEQQLHVSFLHVVKISTHFPCPALPLPALSLSFARPACQANVAIS